MVRPGLGRKHLPLDPCIAALVPVFSRLRANAVCVESFKRTSLPAVCWDDNEENESRRSTQVDSFDVATAVFNAGGNLPDQSESADVIRRASDLIQRGLFGAASDLLTEDLEDHPNDAHVLRALARLRMLERRPEAAIPLLKRALQLLQSKLPDNQQSAGSQTLVESGTNFRVEPHQNPDALATPRVSINAKPLPNTDFEYAAAIERAIEEGREYEPSFMSAPTVDSAPESGGRSVIPYRSDDAENDAQTSSPDVGEEKVPPSNAHISSQHFRPRPFAIHGILKVDAHILDPEDVDDAGVVVEDLYGEDEEPNLGIDDTELPFEEIEEELITSEAAFSKGVTTDVDQRSYEPSLDDFGDSLADELPTRDELRRIPRRLAREDRARQVALELALEFGWDRAGMNLLTSLFVKHWWGAARVALRREIDAGASPREIRLADAVRETWQSYPEFSYHIGYWEQVSQRYTVLPWPTALGIVRAFKGYPDEAEMESFLLDSFDMWWDSDELKDRFDSLYHFIRYRTGRSDESEGLFSWNVFRREFNDIDAHDQLKLLQRLESIGVPVPEWQSDFLPEADLSRNKRSEEAQSTTSDDLMNSNLFDINEDDTFNEEDA